MEIMRDLILNSDECDLEVNSEFTARGQINSVNQTLLFKNTFEEKKRKVIAKLCINKF